ncbi:hypothetical protein [uncultured Aquimarina sp.]|uniref:hypothetical protein n=1 Tax=uncultured Aquimarina sp. TaxID=575652 RepID=UPI002602122C|nr:hypothetical protein [uncultured Aquimarina sp.]
MIRSKLIGILIILLGVLILLYKNDGFYGWGGYIDKSWENIAISSILIITGVFFLKRSKKSN